MGLASKLVNKSLGLAVKGTWLAVRGAYHASTAAASAGFWTAHAAGRGAALAVDYARAPKANDNGDVLCPRSHVVATVGVWRCEKCGFVYEGSAWVCENRECRATTQFLQCETCGLSVRSPFRLGAVP